MVHSHSECYNLASAGLCWPLLAPAGPCWPLPPHALGSPCQLQKYPPRQHRPGDGALQHHDSGASPEEGAPREPQGAHRVPSLWLTDRLLPSTLQSMSWSECPVPQPCQAAPALGLGHQARLSVLCLWRPSGSFRKHGGLLSASLVQHSTGGPSRRPGQGASVPQAGAVWRRQGAMDAAAGEVPGVRGLEATGDSASGLVPAASACEADGGGQARGSPRGPGGPGGPARG